jgi:acyl-CoA reductase-like NAD-dependent aldehyde dehydrogenase
MTGPDSIAELPLSRFLVGGRWIEPAATGRLPVICPSSEREIAHTPDATESDVDAAVRAARQAFDQGVWPRLTPQQRAETLRRLSAALHARAGALAALWVAETGVLASLAQYGPAYALRTLDFYAGLADTFEFAEDHGRSTGAAWLLREPVGVVAAIAPWNAPFATMITKIAPALLAGCTVVMKPAPETPFDAYVIALCAEEAGVPPGVLNLITAGRDASDYLARHPGVDKVSFTGSLAAGRRVASVCGDRIARVTLELGGKSAAIVLDDYDLRVAARSLVGDLCLLSGQNCAALTRVIVDRSRHDALVSLLQAEMENVRIGYPDDPEAQLGPLALARQRDRVNALIDAGVAEGARLMTDRARTLPPTGYFVPPTLFADVSPGMAIAQEEIFGPVLCVLASENEDDAVRIANESRFGLAGAVFTNDADRALAMARRIRTGTVSQNGSRADFEIAFGGFKQSGLGREGGREGLFPYLEAKTVLLEQASRT